jgi:hypothetical protein
MMLDYYGLGAGYPATVPPGTTGIASVKILKGAIQADIISTIPELRPDQRCGFRGMPISVPN